MTRQQSNNDLAVAIATLEEAMKSIRSNQEEGRELYMNYFKRITDKLDFLPSIQSDLLRLNDRLSNHLIEDERVHKGIKDALLLDSADIKALQKARWIRHGISTTLGTVGGFIAGFIHLR